MALSLHGHFFLQEVRIYSCIFMLEFNEMNVYMVLAEDINQMIMLQLS